MKAGKKNKETLHPKNKHRNGYDFEGLIQENNTLNEYVFTNKFGSETIDFSNSIAVKELNRALLQKHYNVSFWDFPEENLCPPIPGRVDYIHFLNDLIGKVDKVKILDIGTGATCIYPLLGNAVYGWDFIGTDISKSSLAHARNIVRKNDLSKHIKLQFQKDNSHILQGILNEESCFTAAMCNPPFYRSKEEAYEANSRKNKGLKNTNSSERNFSGKQQELWYPGGEKAFLHTYLYESSMFKNQCIWYTSLVSKKENVKSLEASAKKLGAKKIKIIPMLQGNKATRIVAWSFKG